MASLIIRPDIGFHLNDLSRKDTPIELPNEILANQRSRHGQRRTIEIDA
jgi:hypothetical protein